MIKLFIILLYTSTTWATLLFYHIPKSAGTSVVTLLGYKYAASNTFRIYTSQSISPYGEKWVKEPFYLTQWTPQLKELNYQNFPLPKNAFVHGHLFFKDGFKHFPSARNITFLRDPLKRIISHQKYWEICKKYYPNSNPNGSHLIPKGAPIESANNLQVYYLSSYSRNDPTISLSKHLESAKDNLLNHFDFVGITEFFDESIRSLYHLLNLGYPPTPPVVNQFSLIKNSYASEEIETLKKLNWADFELYAFGKELFQQKYKHLSTKSTERPKIFFDRIRYTFDSPIEGNGWGYREVVSTEPYYCRTTFLKNSSINFNLKKHSYLVKIFLNSPLAENIFEFKLFANEHHITTKRRNTGEWLSFEGTIPDHVIQDGKSTKISFCIPQLFIPSQHGQILDDRNIGVTVSKIQIEKVN